MGLNSTCLRDGICEVFFVVVIQAMAEDNYLQHTALLLLFICLISSIFLISVSVLEFCRILVAIVGCRLSRTCKI